MVVTGTSSPLNIKVASTLSTSPPPHLPTYSPIHPTLAVKAVYDDHAKFRDSLNAALKGKAPVALAPLQSQTKPDWREAAGGHYNHCLFYECLTPQDDSLAPGPVLRKQFDADFGGEVSERRPLRYVARFGGSKNCCTLPHHKSILFYPPT